MITFDRDLYFDTVRDSLFSGALNQQQVDGQNDILTVWEWIPTRFPDIALDLRWLAYMLATTFHETSQEMWPIEEYGKGSGMDYGIPDAETGQTYYGRGYVQLTWRDNYARATEELGLEGAEDIEWHAQMALDPIIAAKTMFIGMYRGWFRADDDGRQTLERYFNDVADDPFEAREIINGDKNKVPSWGDGSNIGEIIAEYHQRFLEALEQAVTQDTDLSPPQTGGTVRVDITADEGVTLKIWVNGRELG